MGSVCIVIKSLISMSIRKIKKELGTKEIRKSAWCCKINLITCPDKYTFLKMFILLFQAKLCDEENDKLKLKSITTKHSLYGVF